MAEASVWAAAVLKGERSRRGCKEEEGEAGGESVEGGEGGQSAR